MAFEVQDAEEEVEIALVVLAKMGAAEVVIGAAEEVEELAPRVVRGMRATGEVLLLADMLIMVELEELVLGKRVGRMAAADEEVIMGMVVLVLLALELELELELTVDSGTTDMMEAELELVLLTIMLELELELELELGPTVVMGMIGMAARELELVLVLLPELVLLETMGTKVAVGTAEEEEVEEDEDEEELLLLDEEAVGRMVNRCTWISSLLLTYCLKTSCSWGSTQGSWPRR